MSLSTISNSEALIATKSRSRLDFLRVFFAGLLLPLSFAPFHFSGLAILSLALLALQLKSIVPKSAFLIGFVYGLSFFGFGVSWIYVSIHQYGHLNSLLAGFITLIFIAYLSLYTGLFTYSYYRFSRYVPPIWGSLLFSTLWCISEYLRSIIIGGFPWLLLGHGQMDSPLQYLLPLVGVSGVSFITCFAASLLSNAIQVKHKRKYIYLTIFLICILSPLLLKNKQWTVTQSNPVSVAVIQANLSMRDKWDEQLFWRILDYYQQKIQKLLGKKQLIVLPESALPLPSYYISEFLESLDLSAKQENSAILLGIPHAESHTSAYYNALIGLGTAEGFYYKQHLVAFGEFVPSFLSFLNQWLQLPPNLEQGASHQPLISVQGHPIASLICFELAFPEILRQQLPEAEWIVSISDDGWFGHSLAVFQHLQMAQTLSKQTGRYQIVANNDGLSAIINSQGEILEALPAFHKGVLEATLFPASGTTLWNVTGNHLLYGLLFLILIIHFLLFRKPKSNINKLN